MATVVVSLAMIAVGGLLLLMAWLGSQRRLPRNGWAGIRVPATKRSDRAWEAAHVVSAGPVGISGAILALGGLAVGVSGLDNPVGMVGAAVALAGSAVALAIGTRSAIRAAKAADA